MEEMGGEAELRKEGRRRKGRREETPRGRSPAYSLCYYDIFPAVFCVCVRPKAVIGLSRVGIKVRGRFGLSHRRFQRLCLCTCGGRRRKSDTRRGKKEEKVENGEKMKKQ